MMVIFQAEPSKILRKAPLKLSILIVRCSYSPLYDLSSVLPASTAANYILVSAAGFALIRTGGVQSWSSHSGSFHLKLSAAFLFFFSPPPPLLLLQFCLSFVTFPLFLSHPPSNTVLLSSAFSLSYPCSFFFCFQLCALLLLATLSPGLGGSDWVLCGSFGTRQMKLPFL